MVLAMVVLETQLVTVGLQGGRKEERRRRRECVYCEGGKERLRVREMREGV